jgi:hypothetical protein
MVDDMVNACRSWSGEDENRGRADLVVGVDATQLEMVGIGPNLG